MIIMFLASCKSSYMARQKNRNNERKEDKTSNIKPSSSENLNIDVLINRAKKQLGVKYRSGGTEPSSGFDCSGFTKYVFAPYDIKLGSNSTQQSAQGIDISKSKAIGGDLIFFNGAKEGSGSVGHVGIIIENTNNEIKFIHASSSKGIMISSLNEKYFANRFVKIKRVR